MKLRFKKQVFYPKYFIVICLFTLFTSLSCRRDVASSVSEPSVLVEDIASKEVWFRLKSGDGVLPVEVNIYHNNKKLGYLTVKNRDTLFSIENFAPRTEYNLSFNLSFADGSNKVLKSQLTTMDTTTHNFIWQTFTFGNHSANYFLDAAIINDRDIWAVGTIFLNDSLGQHDPIIFNAAHWNGVDWKIVRVPYNYFGTLFYTQLQGVFAFDSNDVWFCGGGLINWDGKDFVGKVIPGKVWGNYQMNKIWGTSRNDLYVIGNHGSIAHFDGTNWEKIESGTEVNLLDVFGTPDGSIVWICGYSNDKPTVLLKIVKKKLFKVIDSRADLFINFGDKIAGAIKSVWAKDNKKVFALTWYDLFRADVNTSGAAKAVWAKYIDGWANNAMRGNDVNDIFSVGVFGTIWHFNGASWQLYQELKSQSDGLYAVAIKGQIAVSVGERYFNPLENYGLIHIGHRGY